MTSILASNLLGIILSVAAASGDDAVDGKKVFTDKKCNACHTVESADVPSLRPDAKNIVDISGLSVKHKADWLSLYLVKKENLKNKPHPTKFKGTDLEMEAMVKWLMTTKPVKQ